MTTLEIKDILIKKINTISDEQLLLEASKLLEIELNEIELPFKLNEEMKLAVNEAKLQLKKNEYLSHEDANLEAEKWLEE